MKFAIRVRLTALFAALFVVLAAVLMATSYAFVSRNTGPEVRGVERAAALQEALTDMGVDFPAREFPERPPNGPGPQNDPLADALHDIEQQTRAQVLRDLLTTSLIAFAISAVFAVGLAYWLAGRVLRPIDEVTRAANSLSESTLDRRLPHEGPEDEFGRLKTSLNGMLDRLERAFESRQRFASDASHELRTPLAVMQASADNTLAAPRAPRQARELAEEVLRQVARSDSLMSSLLTLSRADDVIHTREPVDLADIVATAVSDLEPMATDAGVRLELEVEDAPVLGDRVLLERLVVNLVDNAIRYNAGTDGWVTCRVWSDGDHSIVEIANSGETVRASEVDVLFERFRRGAQRSEVAGHGLGLPIVSRVAEVHGGTVEAVPRESGGLTVTVRLPRVTAAGPDHFSAT
jgi:signal transduction histidine kinase